ncbi:hypothetical protein KM043_018816 [Ampulex compressa]|nr:hypothetical protein KM043_018816 [Ampulex compressa]
MIGTQIAQHSSEIINQDIQRTFAEKLRRGFDNNHLQCYKNQFFGDYKGESRTLLIRGSYEDAQKIWPLSWSHKIQDSISLDMAFKAYKRRMLIRGDQKLRLPKLLEYNSEQLLFIGFANMYCEAPTTLQSTSQASWFKDRGYSNSDTVNMAIMNNEDFGEVFNCSRGTPMNPIKKCSFWQDVPYLQA